MNFSPVCGNTFIFPSLAFTSTFPLGKTLYELIGFNPSGVLVNGTPLSTATISSPASVVIGVVSLGTCVTSAKLLVSIGILGCVPAD